MGVECDNEDVGAKLIRGLRQAGYTRPQEIDHMITKGVKAYGDAIEEYKQKVYERENPDPVEQARLQAERDAQAELDWEKTEKEFADRKKKESTKMHVDGQNVNISVEVWVVIWV